MLIGAHVSPAGGLPKAIERGVERGCEAIQVFNQSPRRWRPTAHSDEDIASFREQLARGPVRCALVHTVYLLNCASEEREIRAKSRESLAHSLRIGARLGARGVVLHPGSAKQGQVSGAIKRAARTIREALSESDGCELHLENTAGAGGTLGRSFAELEALLDAVGGSERVRVCLDSCHLLASGYDIRTAQGVDAMVEELSARVGLERLGSLHLNDSQAPLGANRDRHANIGEGELGKRGCASFLAAPAFESLACVLETPGLKHSGATGAEVKLARELRARGLRARRRRSGARP